MSKSKVSAFHSKRHKQDKDFTQIRIQEDGKILIEFNVWDRSRKQHKSTALKLVPEEAHLLAKMLIHHAKASSLTRAQATALAVTS